MPKCDFEKVALQPLDDCFCFNLLLVGFDFAVFLFCVFYGAFSHLCYHETTNSFIFVYFLLHIHIGLSWHNHLFFLFLRKLSLRLYYLHNFKLLISFQECK